MSIRTRRAGHFGVLAILLSAGGAMAFAMQTPTLGEIAKKEEERRKGITAPAKVYTNKDLPKTSAPQAPPAAPAAPSGTKPAEQKPANPDKPKEKEKEDVKDEAWWRARITTARTELQRNEMALDAFQTRVNSLTNDFAARDDPYQRAQIALERTKTLNELERVKAEIVRIKQQIADIEEEARVAGVPPGWLR